MKPILIIEDDPALRRLLVEVTQEAGYETMEAANGDKALRILTEHPFALVITDIFMPDGDGFYVMREMRRLRIVTPVIAMTGGVKGIDTDLLLETATLLGAATVLPKPFLPSELTQAIHALLQKETLRSAS
ncbi:MAG: response regulator [Magnetococcales bacterium]|nr:response regulator [Magnetococcales bacterium]